MNKYAYITLISTNQYIYPAVTLITSMKWVNPRYPLYIMVTPNITEENRRILKVLGYKIINIEEFIPAEYYRIFTTTDMTQYKGHGTSLSEVGWVHTFSKLKVWELIQFDKVCFLDIDLLILKNIDEVFNYPEFTCTSRDSGLVSSQMFIAVPSLTTSKILLKYANEYKVPFEKFQRNDVPCTDEDILTSFFKYKQYFPHILNYQSFELDPVQNKQLIKDFFNIYVIHPTCLGKPWNYCIPELKNEYHNVYWKHYQNVFKLGIEYLHNKGIDLPIGENYEI